MNLEENVSLKNYSTFKIGGKAKYFCVCEKFEEIEEVLKWADGNNQKVFILGGGSNVLFGDNGFDGLVVKIKNQKLKIKNNKITCGAGVDLGKLVNFSVENNLTGLEWAAGIPGTVGGAVRGNAGAFEEEIGESVLAVKGLMFESKKNRISKNQNDFNVSDSQLPTSEKITNSKPACQAGRFRITDYGVSDCRFDYRDSIFKQNRSLIIWEVELELQKGSKETSKEKIKEILSKRKEKQPLECPSVGSIFENPKVGSETIKQFEKDKETKCKNDKVPAGWLIESCGLGGKKIGGAQVSKKHANFIVNTGNATAEDVVMLISIIKQKIRREFKVQLKEEIEIAI